MFVYDMVIVANTGRNLQHINEEILNINMNINIEKLKLMIIAGNKEHSINIYGQKIEQVNRTSLSKYLITILSKNRNGQTQKIVKEQIKLKDFLKYY